MKIDRINVSSNYSTFKSNTVNQSTPRDIRRNDENKNNMEAINNSALADSLRAAATVTPAISNELNAMSSLGIYENKNSEINSETETTPVTINAEVNEIEDNQNVTDEISSDTKVTDANNSQPAEGQRLLDTGVTDDEMIEIMKEPMDLLFNKLGATPEEKEELFNMLINAIKTKDNEAENTQDVSNENTDTASKTENIETIDVASIDENNETISRDNLSEAEIDDREDIEDNNETEEENDENELPSEERPQKSVEDESKSPFSARFIKYISDRFI